MSAPEIPLEVAVDVCRHHGIHIWGLREPHPSGRRRRRARKEWRERFLSALKEKRRIYETCRAVGVSSQTVYKEASAFPSFRLAMDMAIGRKQWLQAQWDDALEEARSRETIAAGRAKSHDTSR